MFKGEFMKRVYLTMLMIIGAGLAVIPVHSVKAFHFIHPEYLMVENPNVPFFQSEPDVTFDPAGNVHVVYHDNRSLSIEHLFATTLMQNGLLTFSYRAYMGNEGNNHTNPFVFPSTFYTNRNYVGGIDGSGTYNECIMGYYETGSLPATPTPVDQAGYPLAAETVDNLQVLSWNSSIYYAYDYMGDVYLNTFNEEFGIWGTEVILSHPITEESYSAPSFAIDEDGFIYIAYNVFDSMNTQTFLRVRRSSTPGSITAFPVERLVDFYMDVHSYAPKIAVTGRYGNSTLKVAIAYRFPSASMTKIIGNMEENYDWSLTTPDTFSGTGPYDISSELTDGEIVYGPDMIYDAAGDLYIAWSDDRDDIFKLYGNVSYDGGLSMLSSNEVQIGVGIAGIFGEPVLAAGPNPGDIALAYCRNDGLYTSPYLLLSRSTFFDSCDVDPGSTGYWTSYSGIDVVTSMFYSPPGCYRMFTGKGMLLRDFGTEEQQGSVTLQFYDTGSETEDFYVALNNDNLKGVIRMLGVRNETTTYNYSYSYGNDIWVDLGTPRSNGWHEIRFQVDDTGLLMSIGLSGGGVLGSKTDPAFTSFTSVEIEGGSGSSPYFVDDIRVEAFPLEIAPPLPTMSIVSLAILALLLGVVIVRKRSL